jgi:hypothetical protein
VRKRHPEARVDWYGPIGARGKIQGISRWPDGYAINGDVFDAVSIDGYPSERIRAGFSNLAARSRLDLRLSAEPTMVAAWSVHPGMYIGWIWPGTSAGPYFVGFMVQNLESRAQTLGIDTGYGIHAIDLAAHEVKRFAHYCPAAFQEPRTTLTGQGLVRIDGVEVLWGPPSAGLQATIDEALHLGTRDR